MTPVIPYRAYLFHTTLSESAIEAVVRKHTHLGQWDGMLISSKPYYGEMRAGYFEVTACGAHKKNSLKPSLSVFSEPNGARRRVAVTAKPHALLAGLALVFVGACLFYVLLNVLHFFSTGEAAPVVVSIVNLAIVGGCFALPFHFAAGKTLAFWKKELGLQA